MIPRAAVPALLAACLLAACGGTPRAPEDPPPDEPGVPAGPPVGLYVDEDCLLEAAEVLVVLPAVLRPEVDAKALVGEWKDGLFRGHGRAEMRLRRLRVRAEVLVIRVGDGPPGNLRVQAQGPARITSRSVTRLDPPAESILLRPDRVLVQ